MTDDIQEKPRVQVTELAQLSARDVNIELEFPDAVMVVPIRILTLSEWNQCDRDEPTVARVQVSGGPKGPIYDDNDPGYRQGIALRQERVIYRRVLKSLRIPVPGETVDAQLDYLRETLGANAMNGLILMILEAHGSIEARVQARVHSFQGNGHQGE